VILFLPALASFWLTWDDPNNPPEHVAGYNVYRVEFTGTGQMIRTKVNLELIPWQEDTDTTPRFRVEGAIWGEQYRGTAVGKSEIYGENLESEISDDYYTVPFPPAAVPGLTARPVEDPPAAPQGPPLP